MSILYIGKSLYSCFALMDNEVKKAFNAGNWQIVVSMVYRRELYMANDRVNSKEFIGSTL